MKIGLAIQQVRSAESDLADELYKVGERHKTDQEIYHLTKKLAKMSRDHIEELDRYSDRYRVSAAPGGSEEEGGAPGLLGSLREKGSGLLDSVREEGSNLLDPVREKGSEMMGRRPESGLLLLRDLRQLSSLASDVSINWVILGQGAQAARDHELLQTVRECHAQNLRQMKWANTMIKQISPQVLMS
jgi:hypothetical protein